MAYTRVAHAPRVPAFPSFARFVFFMGTVFDAFSEAQEMARAADKRYPFLEA